MVAASWHRWFAERGYEPWSVLGFVLLLTAVLKSDPRTVVAVGGFELLHRPALVTALVCVEAALGCWVLAGLNHRITRRLLIGCFSAFSIAALLLGRAGTGSCNCLGAVRISPWAMLGFDVAVLCGLCFSPRPSAPSLSAWARPRRATAAIVAGVVLCSALSARLWRGTPVDLDGPVALLEPRDWIGRVFPLQRYIDWQGESPALMEGEWLVVLHRVGCPACGELLARLERADEGGMPSAVALVELPSPREAPDGGAGHAPQSARSIATGRIRDDRNWFVETPASIVLRDGIVRSIPDPMRGP
jgi:hypothetical protein